MSASSSHEKNRQGPSPFDMGRMGTSRQVPVETTSIRQRREDPISSKELEQAMHKVLLGITCFLGIACLYVLGPPMYFKVYATIHPTKGGKDAFKRFRDPNPYRRALDDRRIGMFDLDRDGEIGEEDLWEDAATNLDDDALLGEDDGYNGNDMMGHEGWEQTTAGEDEEITGAQRSPLSTTDDADEEPLEVVVAEEEEAMVDTEYVPDTYRSVGHTVDVRGDLENVDVFNKVCNERAYKKELIMITTDMARPEYAASFAKHLVDDWGFDHYIVIGINEGVCAQLHNVGITCLTSSFLEKKRPWNKMQTLKQGYSIGWLWIMRTYMMKRFIECGVNVLSVDSDVAILRDFYADFKGKYKKANLAIQAGSDAFPASCAGVIYHQNAKPNRGTWFFFNEVVQRQIEAMDGPVQIALRGGVEIDGVFSFDQGIVNDVLESSVGAASETCSDHVRNGGSYKVGALSQSHGEAFMARANSSPEKCDASFRQQYREMQAWPDWYEAHTNPDWKWNKNPTQLNALRLPHGQAESELEYVLGVPPKLISGYGDREALEWGSAPSRAPTAIAHAVGQPGGVQSKKTLLKFLGFYKPEMEGANPSTHNVQQQIENGNVKFCILEGMSAPGEGGVYNPPTLDDYKASTQRFFDICGSMGRSPVVPMLPCNLIHPYSGEVERTNEVIIRSNTGKPGSPRPECVFNPYAHDWFQCSETMVLHRHDVERIRELHPEILESIPTIDLSDAPGSLSHATMLSFADNSDGISSAVAVRVQIGSGGVPSLSTAGMDAVGRRGVARLRQHCNACTHKWGGGPYGKPCVDERARDNEMRV